METPSLNSLYLAVSLFVLFILIVAIVCLKIISQDQRLDHILQPEVRVLPVRRPKPLELTPAVKYRKSRHHRSRGSQTAKPTFCPDSDDECHIEDIQSPSAPDFFQDPVLGYESVRAILRPPTTYSQIHQ